MIDEKKLIEALHKWDMQYLYLPLQFEMLIYEQPIVNQWIPVSERLPNHHQRVLCYLKYEPEPPDIISENTYICSGMWMSESDKVVAWMPLPKAYEGEKR